MHKNSFHFRSVIAAIPSHPVDLVRMLTPVRTQATRPRSRLTLAVRSWSLPSLRPAIVWCLLNHGMEHAYMISVPVGPILMSVSVTHWRPMLVSAEKPESSCSGGAHHCVVSKTAQHEQVNSNTCLYYIIQFNSITNCRPGWCSC